MMSYYDGKIYHDCLHLSIYIKKEKKDLNMEFDHTPKYFRNCRDSYDINSKSQINNHHMPEVENKKEQKEPCMKVRYMAVLMGFMGEFFLYYHRITMSVSIVAMVKHSAALNETDLPTTEFCTNLIENNRTGENMKHIEGEFMWSPDIQGYILGSSFLCYVIALPFLSKLAEMFGGKRIICMCIFLSSIFTFISPFAARWNVYALMVVQILRGISQSGILPAEAILIANWCPKHERGCSFTIAICGSAVGAAIGSYVTGVLCESELLGGWPSAFFVNGGMGFLLSTVMMFFLYDNPSVHPRISKVELAYILSNQENALTEKRPKTPWRSLFTSVPVYALSYACFGQMWAMSHFLSANPIFLKTILHYTVEQDGLFNALPFLLQIFTSQIGGILSTVLEKRNFISTDKARKFFTFLSTFGYSACVLGIYFADCNRSLIIILSIAALSLAGFGFAGCWVVFTDMSPTFAGSISAIACSIGSLSHFVLPVVIGHITNDAQTMEQWHKAFIICIAVVLSSGILFVIFGSAEIQPWNEVSEEKPQEMEETQKYNTRNND